MGETRKLVGGPLDGEEIPVDGMTEEDIREGWYLIVPGWERRADYAADEDGVIRYRGEIP